MTGSWHGVNKWIIFVLFVALSGAFFVLFSFLDKESGGGDNSKQAKEKNEEPHPSAFISFLSSPFGVGGTEAAVGENTEARLNEADGDHHYCAVHPQEVECLSTMALLADLRHRVASGNISADAQGNRSVDEYTSRFFEKRPNREMVRGFLAEFGMIPYLRGKVVRELEINKESLEILRSMHEEIFRSALASKDDFALTQLYRFYLRDRLPIPRELTDVTLLRNTPELRGAILFEEGDFFSDDQLRAVFAATIDWRAYELLIARKVDTGLSAPLADFLRKFNCFAYCVNEEQVEHPNITKRYLATNTLSVGDIALSLQFTESHPNMSVSSFYLWQALSRQAPDTAARMLLHSERMSMLRVYVRDYLDTGRVPE